MLAHNEQSKAATTTGASGAAAGLSTSNSAASLVNKTTAHLQADQLKAGVQSSASSTHTVASNHTHGSSHSHHSHQSHQSHHSHYPQQSHPGIHYKAYHPDPELLYHDTGIDYNHVLMNRNASVAKLYEDALRYEEGTIISSTGALVTSSGKKTGRSPKDKRIVDESSTSEDIWWGPVNTKLSEHAFLINHERAVDYLNTRERLYVFDGYAGWDPKYRCVTHLFIVFFCFCHHPVSIHCRQLSFSLPLPPSLVPSPLLDSSTPFFAHPCHFALTNNTLYSTT
jgi:hypothetical protein